MRWVICFREIFAILSIEIRDHETAVYVWDLWLANLDLRIIFKILLLRFVDVLFEIPVP